MYHCLDWYALKVRERTENLTAKLLNLKGYKPYLRG
jgi:hypothetical protein